MTECTLMPIDEKEMKRVGTGFEQPLQPHQHWPVDVSYINLSGTF
jgi:hypothetical protein